MYFYLRYHYISNCKYNSCRHEPNVSSTSLVRPSTELNRTLITDSDLSFPYCAGTSSPLGRPATPASARITGLSASSYPESPGPGRPRLPSSSCRWGTHRGEEWGEGSRGLGYGDGGSNGNSGACVRYLTLMRHLNQE